MSISSLSSSSDLDVVVKSVTVYNGINTNNSKITNVADGTNPTDAVNLQQVLNLVVGIPPVVTFSPLNNNLDLSSYNYTNNNTTVIVNPTADYYVKLPNPIGLQGFSISIVDESNSGHTISLCTDNYITTLKSMAGDGNGIKILCANNKYLFFIL